MERVLITGGAGYIGSILTEVLLSKGYYVTIIDNLMYDQLSIVHFSSNKKFNFILGDVEDESLLKKLVNENDIIIPLAAIVGMPACKANPILAKNINYLQIKNIVDYSSNQQMILMPNTNSQYGSSIEIITEESPFKPLSLYAETKCDAEKCILDSGNGIALRLATVFGLSYRMRLDLLVNDFVFKSLTDKYLVLFESNFVRNYIHVRDVSSAFLFMIENYHKCNNNAYNVGLSDANLTKLDLSNLIKNEISDLVIIKNDFSRDEDKRNYIVSNKKIESFGWKASITIEDGIKELINGYKSIIKIKNKGFTNI